MSVVSSRNLFACCAFALIVSTFGCGSGRSPVDAAGEQAIRAEFSKAEAAERQNLSQATPSQVNRMHEGEVEGDRPF